MGPNCPWRDLPAFRGKIVYAAVTARFERTRVANIGVRGNYYVEKCCLSVHMREWFYLDTEDGVGTN